MKKNLQIFATTLLICFLHFNLQAQWTELGGTNTSTLTYYPSELVKDAGGSLFAGGSCFTNSNGKYFLAKWNGTTWTEVGGANTSTFSGSIYKIVFDAAGNIYVAGNFVNGNGKAYIAKWNGNAWTELGGKDSSIWPSSSIMALYRAKDGNLYAAGDFKNASVTRYVAKWNDTAWSEVKGVNTIAVNGTIGDINSDTAGNIYASGQWSTGAGKTSIAKWDGTTWTKIAITPKSAGTVGINGLLFDKAGNIYTTGPHFINTNGDSYIAKWDGTAWTELGGANTTPFNMGVRSRLVKDPSDNIYIGSDFVNAKGYSYVAKWDGSSWSELGGKDSSSFGTAYSGQGIYKLLCDASGTIYCTGDATLNGNGKYYVAVYGKICTPTNSIANQTACDSFAWNGTVYKTSGAYNKKFVGGNANGCDSTANLNLTISNATTSSTIQTACDSFVWNAITYKTSGTYNKTFTGGNAQGCDSIATLVLTINKSTTSSTIQTACDSFVWNAITYKTSGTYNKTFISGNAQGCDSIATLVLTINKPTSSTTNKSICGSYIWNGTTYTTAGTYNKKFVGGNSKGCDSTATLILILGNTTSSSTNKISCGSYLWNGTTYTTSGTYNKTFVGGNSSGCDSIATLNLTINTDPIDAQLLVASQLFKNETEIVINVSKIKSDSIKWILPNTPSLQVVSKTNDLLELKFTDTGSYNIGLQSFVGLCEKTTLKKVVVIEGSSFKNIGATRDPFIKEFKVAPNPTTGVFTAKVKLSSQGDIRVRLMSIYNNLPFDDRKLTGDKEYSLDYNLNLTPGIYILILETPKGSLINKIIVP